jgi:U3 small nucleolar RNA-associated protein 6
MKKRKRFEYKMQRRTKEKEVYLEYIQYEIGVLKLVRLRREVTLLTLKHILPDSTETIVF